MTASQKLTDDVSERGADGILISGSVAAQSLLEASPTSSLSIECS